MMVENKRIVIHRLGESFRECTRLYTETLDPPTENEVLIRNHFAGINGVYDQMMCLDRIEHTRVVPPANTGVEAVGQVVAVGAGVNQVAVGDSVASVNVGNAYSLYQLCAASSVVPIPSLDPAMLALIPSGVSALLALEQVGELSSGEVVCISAAAGGLGNIATQLALQADNHVIAICGNDEKADWLNELGVDRVVQYRRESLAEVIDEEYPDALDLVMESVGGETFDALVRNLAPRGRLVVCGHTSDRLPPEQVTQERIYTSLYWKSASVRGFMNYRFAEHAPAARERLFDMVAKGDLNPRIDAREFRGLDAIADAVEHLLEGRNLGKVVVDLRD
jgi:NADPH-dependent curcumin reductase CurA